MSAEFPLCVPPVVVERSSDRRHHEEYGSFLGRVCAGLLGKKSMCMGDRSPEFVCCAFFIATPHMLCSILNFNTYLSLTQLN